jgi:hypothetical protein
MKRLFVIIAVLGVAAFSLGDATAASPLRSVGIQAGYVSPENIDGTWTVGFGLDFGLPVTNLYVQPFLGYWNYSETVFGLEASITDWTIGGNLKYVIPTSAPKVRPFVAGGAAVHMLNASTEGSILSVPVSIDVSDNQFGFQAGGGLIVDASPRVSIIGSGFYHIVENYNQWMVGGGVQINL